jgi:hypothetical protein
MPRNFELVTQQDADIELFRVTIIAELEAMTISPNSAVMSEEHIKRLPPMRFTKTQVHWFQME